MLSVNGKMESEECPACRRKHLLGIGNAALPSVENRL